VRKMTKIKICGLMGMRDIEAVNEALPDYIGFVFAESRRRISPELAMELKGKLDGRILAVGVFVDESPGIVADLCAGGVIDLIQLHGSEDENYIEKLKSMNGVAGKPIIKAVRVKSRLDIEKAEGLPCDYLLLDAHSDRQAGGTGEGFDWSLAGKPSKPFFLAGGLNADNLLDAIDRVRPYGLDVSSGAETGGVKDRNKILEIVKIVRGSDI